MSISLQEHIRESVLKTALFHMLKNGHKSPERTARNIEELLLKFNHGSGEIFHASELLTLIKSQSPEECLNTIMNRLS